MTVALFSDTYLPTKNGVVTSVCQLRSELMRRGHRTLLFVPGGNRLHGIRQSPDDPDTYYVPSLSLSRDGELQVCLCRRVGLLRRAVAAGVEVVHTHTEFRLGRVGRYIARRLHVPHVHSCHTLWTVYLHYLPRVLHILPLMTMTRTLLRRWYVGSGLVIAPSVRAQEWLTSTIGRTEGIRVVPNGVRSGDDQGGRGQAGRSVLPARSDEIVVLFAGRIAREKRVAELCCALAGTLREAGRLRLVFAGGGPAYPQVVHNANELGVAGKVSLTGWLPWERMHDQYRAADIFCTASLSEIQPLTLIEAAQSGLPIVARRDAGVETVVEDRVNGILVNSDEGLAGAVAELADNPELRYAYAENSRRIGAGFNSKNHANGVLRVYAEAKKVGAGSRKSCSG